jgi:hypothetical protein
MTDMYKAKLLALGITLMSTPLLAGTAGAATDDNLTLAIPDLKPGFGAEAAILWLKPGASNLNYVIWNQGTPVQSPSWTEQELNPSLSPAFEVGLRYIFPKAGGKDARLSWTHLNSSTSDSATSPGAASGVFLGPDYEIGPPAIPIQHATGNVTFNYDVINLEVGQFLSFGRNLNMHFFGGLGAGVLEETIKTSYSRVTQQDPIGPFVMRQTVSSNFSGVGPRVGIQADYKIQQGLGFVGEGATTLLTGSMHSKTSYIGSAPELLTVYGQTQNYQTIKDQRVYQVVPGFDAKLGVNYERAFDTERFFKHLKGLLKLEAGYQAAVYINAISQYLPGTLVQGESLDTGGVFVATINHTLSNYSVQGPYAQLRVQL